jgi:hypothetical protein
MAVPATTAAYVDTGATQNVPLATPVNADKVGAPPSGMDKNAQLKEGLVQVSFLH